MLTVFYEDKDIIICKKPVGVLSQEGGSGDNMLSLLNAYFKESDGGAQAFCVHRLDRAVGGVMVFAKNQTSAGKLSSLISGGKFNKLYLAVIRGKPENESGIYEDLLFKDSSKNKSFVVKRMRKGVKRASLEYEMLGFNEENNASLVRIKLHTGRTHQIRVQFASRQTPLLGDGKYGSGDNSCGVALWSYRISFVSPFTGRETDVKCPPPEAYPWNLF